MLFSENTRPLCIRLLRQDELDMLTFPSPFPSLRLQVETRGKIWHAENSLNGVREQRGLVDMGA